MYMGTEIINPANRVDIHASEYIRNSSGTSERNVKEVPEGIPHHGPIQIQGYTQLVHQQYPVPPPFLLLCLVDLGCLHVFNSSANQATKNQKFHKTYVLH